MFNSLVRLHRTNCSRWINLNSFAPSSLITRRTYAAYSKGNNVYTNFMSANPDLSMEKNTTRKSKWLSHNDKVYAPQDPSEERRPAFVCHELINVKYSIKKMWYVCAFIRGMSVEEALRQLDFICRKGSVIAKQAINEAVEMAVNEHNVEFKTNLWIAECFPGRGLTMKGLRRHAKGRIGIVHYRYCNFYIRLEEGQPPADYMNRGDRSGPALLEKWVTEMRNRRVIGSL